MLTNNYFLQLNNILMFQIQEQGDFSQTADGDSIFLVFCSNLLQSDDHSRLQVFCSVCKELNNLSVGNMKANQPKTLWCRYASESMAGPGQPKNYGGPKQFWL